MKPVIRRLFVLFLSASLLAATACAGSGATEKKDDSRTTSETAATPVHVKLLAFNDFHGNLQGPVSDVEVDGEEVPAGGLAQLAALIQKKRAEHPNTIVVAAGDMIGASPLISALLHDEPTIEGLNKAGLMVTSVGNHEFDEGLAELERMANGGCHPEDGCTGDRQFNGAEFQFLAANVLRDGGETVFPATMVRDYGGVKIGFIGLTLEGTGDIVTPSAVEGLTFADEVQTIDKYTAELREQGVEAIVVLIHEGARPENPGTINDCGNLDGPVVDIVENSDPEVDVFVTGHTHRTYVCDIDGRLVTSAMSYGRLLTEIDLKIDPETNDVVEKSAANFVVRTEGDQDQEVAELVAFYEGLTQEVAGKRVGAISATLGSEPGPDGESTMGKVIADAQLAATSDSAGAQLALMNPGGVRSPLEHEGSEPTPVTYADLHRVQPFNNTLVTMTLTGQQIHDVLEQQFRGEYAKVLLPSAGFHYTWNKDGEIGDRVDPASITLDGEPLDLEATYRVTVNNYLADGGDGFETLTAGEDRHIGPVDLEAAVDYFSKNSPVSAPGDDRIEVE
ncbi:MAG: bifunctional metallophosphatase/5'-nucleotidase [Myxococcota bacterium]